MSESPWIGRTIDGRYRIDALLGEGGMGAVFLAEHLRLGKRVALKMILPEHAGNAELATRFARESMVTASLEHPHIVSALDTGTLPEGGAYLVMTLAAGTSSSRLLRSQPGVRLACEVGAQIADALAAAHARGVVHRDLKPDNVMVEVREDGSLFARVLDFGIARAADVATTQGGTPLTRVGAILGTPGYMPPEQALGETVDHRADLYALGVVLWELTCGKTLFPQGDLREIVLAQLTEPIPPLTDASAPAELTTLLDALLMPKRDDRPTSAADVRDRLLQIARASQRTGPQPSVAPLSSSIAHDAATAKTEYAAPSPSLAQTPRVDLGTALSSFVTRLQPIARSTAGRAIGALLLLVVAGTLTVRACTSESAATALSPTTASPAGVVAALAASFGGPLADVPTELREDARTLIESPDDAARLAAATRVLPMSAQVPPFAAHLAAFELAEDCSARRDAVRALRDDGDPRAIPALQRMQDLPRRGCAPLGMGDCHRCFRRDLDRTLERLIADEHGDTSPEDDADEGRGHEKRRRRR